MLGVQLALHRPVALVGGGRPDLHRKVGSALDVGAGDDLLALPGHEEQVGLNYVCLRQRHVGGSGDYLAQVPVLNKCEKPRS
jgi:hypothetical protein